MIHREQFNKKSRGWSGLQASPIGLNGVSKSAPTSSQEMIVCISSQLHQVGSSKLGMVGMCP